MKALIKKMGMLKWLWITAIAVILDQATKQWAEHSLEKFTPVEVISNLNWYLTYNKGAAFSFLSEAGGWQRWFFTAIALIVGTAIVFWMRSLKPQEKVSAIGLALILSGAIGNVIDRILYGKVIDFIQFYYQGETCLWGFSRSYLLGSEQCVWPAFNIADSAIFIGAAILITQAIREIILERKRSNETQA